MQGPVLPWWQQGSSVTNIVAPAGFAALCAQSRSASISACGPPNRRRYAASDDFPVADKDATHGRVRLDPPGRPYGPGESPSE